MVTPESIETAITAALALMLSCAGAAVQAQVTGGDTIKNGEGDP